MSFVKLYIENDMVLEVNGLKNPITGSYINTGSVWATVYDTTSTVVSGQTFPLLLSYVQNTDGVYRGTIESSLSLMVGQQYFITIRADGGSGLYAHWNREARAFWRVE